MDEKPGREPLLSGRGVLLIEDFCRSTGLAHDTVEHLMRTGRIAGALWQDEEESRPFGIFDDALPSRAALAAVLSAGGGLFHLRFHRSDTGTVL